MFLLKSENESFAADAAAAGDVVSGVERRRNLSRAEVLVEIGRAPTVAAAWAQIREADREREWQRERRRREAWRRYNARQNAADNVRRSERPRKNEVNARRRYEFINRCFRVKAHIVRHAGVFTEKSRAFYAALRAAELAVIGRIFAKRAAARFAAELREKIPVPITA